MNAEELAQLKPERLEEIATYVPHCAWAGELNLFAALLRSQAEELERIRGVREGGL